MKFPSSDVVVLLCSRRACSAQIKNHVFRCHSLGFIKNRASLESLCKPNMVRTFRFSHAGEILSKTVLVLLAGHDFVPVPNFGAAFASYFLRQPS
ncbi:hypothetical protein [Undibacterium sp.]|uniref:hypothetical protein n=1 Tax=Undibacterium sp. TaxID=1914977 RepID=UPI00273037A9|nr:hypothetical protein [Undibacterium sp.]MDP1977676.1 hypothetical protein [Undibacterium sp.]